MKILVINLMHLGDLLLVTPILRSIKLTNPDVHLTLLADKKLGDVVKWNPHLDDCLLIDKRGALLSVVRRLRAEKYDLVINLHRNERASFLAALSGGRRIVGYSKPGFSLLFDKVLPNLKAVKHQIHSHFDVLKACGFEVVDGALELHVPAETEQAAAELCKKNFGDSLIVAVNIGASWLTKRWIDDYFAQCADLLLERGFGVAMLGGPTDIEIVNKCVEKMRNGSHARLKIFTGQFSLAMLAAFMSQCSLLLTTDSGPMHVGVARHIPIVTMFGASPVPGFYPYDAKDILIKTPEPCHPCGQHVCPRAGDDNLACMKKISVAAVMKYVDELLSTYDRPAKEIARVPDAYECRVIDLANTRHLNCNSVCAMRNAQ